MQQRQQVRPYKVQDPSAKLVPSFTRRRERAVGRLAMLGVAAMWAGEVRRVVAWRQQQAAAALFTCQAFSTKPPSLAAASVQ